MRFLCPNHYHQLNQHSPQTLEKNWFEWMNKAALFYGVGAWKQSQAYAGCALDVALMLLNKPAAKNASQQITLASLYLANSLEHEGLFAKAALVLQVAEKAVNFCCQHCRDTEAKHCLNVLQNKPQQAAFFEQRLNMPFDVPPKKPKAQTLH